MKYCSCFVLLDAFGLCILHNTNRPCMLMTENSMCNSLLLQLLVPGDRYHSYYGLSTEIALKTNNVLMAKWTTFFLRLECLCICAKLKFLQHFYGADD